MAGLWFRVLTFRATGEELRSLGWGHLVAGLLCTWIVGIGRYWDHPRATLPQYLGLRVLGGADPPRQSPKQRRRARAASD